MHSRWMICKFVMLSSGNDVFCEKRYCGWNAWSLEQLLKKSVSDADVWLWVLILHCLCLDVFVLDWIKLMRLVYVLVNRSKAGRAYLTKDNLDVTNNPSSCNTIVDFLFFIFIYLFIFIYFGRGCFLFNY
jgi:hypothetical protein